MVSVTMTGYECHSNYHSRFLLKNNRFIDFGRGKNIPLTPDNDNLDQIRIKSNTGRIIIDKTISDLGLKSNYMNEMPESSNRYVIDKNGKIMERKKKCRLYSLGGNEPRKSHLVRMKTVGTFDLCMEVTALACGFNQEALGVVEPAIDTTQPVIEESIEVFVHPEKYDSEDAQVVSISSPKRQRHISSSENSIAVDDSSIISNTKKKFRSLSSSPYHTVHSGSDEFRCKSADLLGATVKSYDEILNTAASASEIRHKSDDKIYEYFNSECDAGNKTSDDEFLKSRPTSSSYLPSCARRRTFKKSKKIVRTDSELFKEQIITNATIEVNSTKRPNKLQVSTTSSIDGSEQHSRENLSPKNISTDTVFSDMCDQEQIDLEKLEIEYKEHVKSNLQREYKSDGDSLDEIGKERPRLEWKNQSVDFEFLEEDKVNELCVKKSSMKKIRNDSESRTKSEGDKDTLYSKADSTETQSTEDENKIEVDQQTEGNKVEKQQSLFEKRFGKLKKMNKLLKVKRFSTSALYDKRKTSETSKAKESQPQVISALSQVNDFASSKTSLASPKSLKGKRFQMKKRKFSFFGKSVSNNDLNLNLKSLASKLSLLSKSNFDLSKNSSNLRLNAVGMYGKYGSSNEYRSDVITSPLSEAFYNETGSYQLTPMELFEKFCSQDFTGLYKHETISEDETPEADNQAYKGAIKKSSSLRKSMLLKQNSEPKFNVKNYPLDQFYTTPQEVFEEEEIESGENEEDEYEYNMSNAVNRRSSYSRQLEFDQNSQYYEDDPYYISENPELYRNSDDDIDEIYLMPDKQGRYDGYMRNSEEILAIDETDEEILEDSEDLLEENADVETTEIEVEFNEKEKLLALYEICPRDEDGLSDSAEDKDSNLKSIITEYVKNACASAAGGTILPRSQSMDLLSNSSETLKSNSNSEYAFDTVKQFNLDSCSTSKLSLSLNSDIFDDITLAAPSIDNIKTIKICEMDDFTLTPDGSMSETNNEGKIAALTQVSEQQKIQNELQSQYTIIDCDELEHDEESENQRFNDEKSSFAEALNKEFDKLFSRAKTDSDTITSTPSVNTSAATVLTAIKIPSRCSMEKLEALPYEFDQETLIGGISETKEEKPVVTLLSQSMTSTTLNQSIGKKEDLGKGKSKRSLSVGALHKRKSNKCTPL